MATLLTSTEPSGQVVNDHFRVAQAEQPTDGGPFSPWLRQALVAWLRSWWVPSGSLCIVHWSCAIVAQPLALTLSAPVPAGAEPSSDGAAQATAQAADRVTVKAGWELARIREYARGDPEIKGEIKPGESWPCSGGCGTVAGGHVQACGSSGNQRYAISYYGYVRYVSATCGTFI